jgi:7SK snRNA methylphosphate capping enzyme
LSVTKWIHLNGGDQGIKDFFAKAFECLKPNGRLVIEPQPWSSYDKARRIPELQESHGQLKLRPDDFQRILLDDIGFKSVEELGAHARLPCRALAE